MRSASARVGRTATALLAAGVVAHTFLIGMQTVQAGYAPLVGTTAAISAFVWLLGLAYLYVELTTDERAMGMFVSVLLALLSVLPALNPDVEPRPPLLRSPLFTVHVLSMLFAYASFALACVVGITYVLLFKEIKAKHLGFFYSRLPALQVLDVMNGRAITVGWLFLTCGVLVGGIWAMQIHSSPDPRAQAMSVEDPEDPRGAALLGGVHVRAVRAANGRLERTPRRVALGDRLPARPAELRSGRVFPDPEPQFLAMRLLAVGISHRTAPVELRESVDFGRGGLETALSALAARGLGREVVLLSTCNRSEIYLGADADAAADACARFMSDYHGIAHDSIAPHLFVHRGADVAQHLFRVAAGLDSMVVGEPQILGQVKDAYAKATAYKSTGALTNRLFTSAFSVGKRVRSETGLGEGAVSVSYAAISLAKKIFGDLTGLDVLILGAGEMAKLTGVHLQAQRVGQLSLVSRTLSTAQTLARRVGGRARPWDQLDKALAAADIVDLRDRRARTGPDARRHRGRHAAAGATGRCS